MMIKLYKSLCPPFLLFLNLCSFYAQLVIAVPIWVNWVENAIFELVEMAVAEFP